MHAYGKLKAIGINSFEDFRKFDPSQLDNLGMTDQLKDYIKNSIEKEIQDQEDNLLKRREQHANNGQRKAVE